MPAHRSTSSTEPPIGTPKNGSRQTSQVIVQLERLAVELVSVTNTAIAEVAGGELSLPQWRLLVILGHASAPIRVYEIAAGVSASMPSASRLVERMERRGLVASAPDPNDGRGRQISLTKKGAELRAQVLARRRASLEAGLTDFVAKPELIESLERIIEGLRNRS